MPDPSIDDQTTFWNDWVAKSKSWETNRANARRRVHVLENVRATVERMGGAPKMLDVACGSGWLARELAEWGQVTALDLADQIIDELRGKYPRINWLAGDFLTMKVDGPFDIVTCVEALASVRDQPAFAARIAELVRPGGTLVLTTQNPFVWNRTSWLTPLGQGQVRQWVPRRRLLSLFERHFRMIKLTTCAPSGDRGVVKILNNRWSVKLGGALVGNENWVRARERMWLGCSIVLVATRR